MAKLPDEMTTGRCAICGGDLGADLLTHTQPDRFERAVGIGAEGYWRAWRACTRCGSATNIQRAADHQRLASIASRYYEIDFTNSNIADKYRTVMNLPAAQSDNAGRVARIHAFLESWRLNHPSGSAEKVLDIGAGTGVFLSRFLQQATTPWTATALEPDDQAAAHLRSLNLFAVRQELFTGSLDLKDLALVTLNKVLEHLPAPEAILSDVLSVLDPARGVFYVEVPDVMTIGRRPATDNILGALHCHLYSMQGLACVLQNAGFTVVAAQRVLDPSGKLSLCAFACAPSAYAAFA